MMKQFCILMVMVTQIYTCDNGHRAIHAHCTSVGFRVLWTMVMQSLGEPDEAYMGHLCTHFPTCYNNNLQLFEN